ANEGGREYRAALGRSRPACAFLDGPLKDWLRRRFPAAGACRDVRRVSRCRAGGVSSPVADDSLTGEPGACKRNSLPHVSKGGQKMQSLGLPLFSVLLRGGGGCALSRRPLAPPTPPLPAEPGGQSQASPASALRQSTAVCLKLALHDLAR